MMYIASYDKYYFGCTYMVDDIIVLAGNFDAKQVTVYLANIMYARKQVKSINILVPYIYNVIHCYSSYSVFRFVY